MAHNKTKPGWLLGTPYSKRQRYTPQKSKVNKINGTQCKKAHPLGKRDDDTYQGVWLVLQGQGNRLEEHGQAQVHVIMMTAVRQRRKQSLRYSRQWLFGGCLPILYSGGFGLVVMEIGAN
jgi:hypothetical protein